MTTWLKGLTTWANLVTDMTKLMAGEITDGAGNTCAVADRWVREIAGQELLRSHASQDVALGNMSNRMGYFSQFGGFSLGSDDWHGARASVCRCTNVFTSAPGGATRWIVHIGVATANSVAGNYSTAVIRWVIFNMDTGVQISTSSGVSPNAAGVLTIANGMQVTLSDSTGFLITTDFWARQFDTTFMGGIDWYGPMHCMRNGTAVSFSVSPSGGSQPTDWDIADVTTTAATFSITWSGPNIPVPRGGQGQGVGIKTNTALTGNLYTYSYSAAQHKIIFTALSGGSNGQILMEHHQDLGNDGGTYRRRMGFGKSPWLRPFQTPGSVTAGAAVQYFMAVGPASVAIVLNGDPLNSGKLTFNMLGLITPYQPTYDKFPGFIGGVIDDYTAENTSQNPHVNQRYNLWEQKKRQDASENRDWQTGWSRCDFQAMSTSINFEPLGNGNVSSTNPGHDSFGSLALRLMGSVDQQSSGLYEMTFFNPHTEKPSDFDGKWWLLELVAYDTPLLTQGGNVYASNIDSSKAIRGTIKDCFFTATGGFSSGDELLDTDTSKQYLLVVPDYTGFYFRPRVNNNDYRGGFAILEAQ